MCRMVYSLCNCDVATENTAPVVLGCATYKKLNFGKLRMRRKPAIHTNAKLLYSTFILNRKPKQTPMLYAGTHHLLHYKSVLT